MPLTLKGYARIKRGVRPLFFSKIKRKAIQLLTSHSKEISRNLPSWSKLIAHVLMIRTDKDKVTGNKLICLLRRGTQIFLPENREREKNKNIFMILEAIDGSLVTQLKM